MRVFAVGMRRGLLHREAFGTVRSALHAARDADEDFTWVVDHIEVDGVTVIESDEIAERTTYGRYDNPYEPTESGHTRG